MFSSSGETSKPFLMFQEQSVNMWRTVIFFYEPCVFLFLFLLSVAFWFMYLCFFSSVLCRVMWPVESKLRYYIKPRFKTQLSTTPLAKPLSKIQTQERQRQHVRMTSLRPTAVTRRSLQGQGHFILTLHYFLGSPVMFCPLCNISSLSFNML